MILPVLPVNDVAATMDYYINTLGFSEVLRMPGQDGTMITGQVHMDNAHIMFNLNPAMASKAGGGVYFWVRMDDADIDAYYDTLKGNNIEIVDEIQNQFWGDRSFTIKDVNDYTLVFTKAIGAAMDASQWSSEHGKSGQSFES